jgi:small-conductance mechanosensitive channel
MFWTEYKRTHTDFLSARHDAIMNITKKFRENDITIPFPIRTLDFGIKGGEKLSTTIGNTNLSLNKGGKGNES